MTREELQDWMDTAFPGGVSVVVSSDWQFHSPRVMVEDVAEDDAVLMVWPMETGDQPFFFRAELPTKVSGQMKLRTEDEAAPSGFIELYNAFPDTLKAERREWLQGGWFG